MAHVLSTTRAINRLRAPLAPMEPPEPPGPPEPLEPLEPLEPVEIVRSSAMSITRREFSSLVGSALAAAALPLNAQPRPSAPVLEIDDWSYFWYGVERVKLARGSVVNGGQMFVERWIPSHVRFPYSVVLIHGG